MKGKQILPYPTEGLSNFNSWSLPDMLLDSFFRFSCKPKLHDILPQRHVHSSRKVLGVVSLPQQGHCLHFLFNEDIFLFSFLKTRGLL